MLWALTNLPSFELVSAQYIPLYSASFTNQAWRKNKDHTRGGLTLSSGQAKGMESRCASTNWAISWFFKHRCCLCPQGPPNHCALALCCLNGPAYPLLQLLMASDTWEPPLSATLSFLFHHHCQLLMLCQEQVILRRAWIYKHIVTLILLEWVFQAGILPCSRPTLGDVLGPRDLTVGICGTQHSHLCLRSHSAPLPSVKQ